MRLVEPELGGAPEAEARVVARVAFDDHERLAALARARVKPFLDERSADAASAGGRGGRRAATSMSTRPPVREVGVA